VTSEGLRKSQFSWWGTDLVQISCWGLLVISVVVVFSARWGWFRWKFSTFVNEGNKVSSLTFTTFVIFGLLLERNAEVYEC
jgi:hypothetical protein